jgi:hypothetical protein
MRGISDLLAALYGGEQVIYRMIERPDEVHECVARLTDYWISFGQCLLRHVPQFHGGTGAFFYNIWTPGKTIWMQEDAAALLSPGLYEEFIKAADDRICRAFESSVIHLHPSRFIPADYFLDMPVDVIELHFDRGGPSAPDLLALHRKILAKKPLLVFGDLIEKDLDFMIENLPWKGLAINMAVASVEAAREVWNHFEDAAGKPRAADSVE